MSLKQNGNSFCPVFNIRWAYCCRKKATIVGKQEKDVRREFEARAEEGGRGRRYTAENLYTRRREMENEAYEEN